MNIYRHYKNKFYKLHGTAKHSESLEDLAIYESLYENSLSKLWARPLRMFEEKLEIDGIETFRFSKVQLNIREATKITAQEEQELSSLIKETLGEWNPNTFRSKLKDKTGLLLLIAEIDQHPVGFKIGYQLDSQIFYSWLGGILPEFRKWGIASELMTTQHQWCTKQGYKKVRTKTQNRYKPMLSLNIKHGFDIVGTETSEQDHLKILLEKIL